VDHTSAGSSVGWGYLDDIRGGGVAHICQLSSTCADEEGVKHAGNKR
jgi:hypothetical protein